MDHLLVRLPPLPLGMLSNQTIAATRTPSPTGVQEARRPPKLLSRMGIHDPGKMADNVTLHKYGSLFQADYHPPGSFDSRLCSEGRCQLQDNQERTPSLAQRKSH